MKRPLRKTIDHYFKLKADSSRRKIPSSNRQKSTKVFLGMKSAKIAWLIQTFTSTLLIDFNKLLKPLLNLTAWDLTAWSGRSIASKFECFVCGVLMSSLRSLDRVMKNKVVWTYCGWWCYNQSEDLSTLSTLWCNSSRWWNMLINSWRGDPTNK